MELKLEGKPEAHPESESPNARTGEFILRMPTAEDAPHISRLIGSCPPLDTNSLYSTLLLCTDFAATCVVAERSGEAVGWISAYRPPTNPDRLFVWQVAVSPAGRGEGLGGRMLDEVIARPEAAGASMLTTTITQDNTASWALFEGFARRHGARLRRTCRFDSDLHFGGAHETEWEARIAPLPNLAT